MKSKSYALVVFTACALLNHASAQNTFKASATLTSSSGVNLNFPAQVIAADVNLDGKMDLICADTVLTNNGKGIFSKAFSLPATFRPSGFVAMDVNRDGKMDLVTLTNVSSSPFNESIVVYTNSGPISIFPFGLNFGVFSSTTNVGGTTASLINGTQQGNGSLAAAGDVYGNGRANLFYYNSISNSVSLYTNNGAGVFGSNTTFNLPMHLPVAADINGDGKVDFIAPNYSNSIVYIFTNNGFGTYASNAAVKVKAPAAVVTADLNGDTWPDLIFLSLTNAPGGFSNTVSIWTNNGSGTFGSNTSFTVGSLNQRIMDIKAAQVFGDGQVDLVLAMSDLPSQSANTLIIYTNNGLGGYGSNLTVSVGSQTAPAGLAVADVNGDGTLDLISANAGTTYGLTVFTNSGTGLSTGSFLSNSMPVLPTNSFVLAAADLYRNGNLDLISAPNVSPPTLLVLTNNNAGVFGSNAVITGFTPNAGNFSVAARPITADIFGNGSPALIVSLYSFSNAGLLTVLTNNGSGLYLTNSFINIPLVANDVVAADVNGDGKLDLIATCYAPSGGGSDLIVLTNNGAGGFGTNLTFILTGFSRLAVADVNSDGRPDLIVSTVGSTATTVGKLTIYTNISASGFGPLYSATFPAPATYAVSTNPVALVTADVNGDGKIDVIIANNTSPGTLSILTNNGAGIFGLLSSPVVGAYPHALAAADVNSDGKIDLITANWGLTTNVADARGPLSYGTLSVLTNNGSGAFTNIATFSTGMGPSIVIAADVNGDGKPDLITANITSYTNQAIQVGNPGNTLSVLLNTSNFVNVVALQTAPGYSAITYGQNLSAAGLGGGAATNEAGGAIVGAFSFNNTVPPAGTANYPVTFTPAPPTDYQPFSFNVSLTVSQLVAILKGHRAYDGTTNVVAGVLSVSNKVGSDNVTVSAGSVGLDSAAVGTNNFTSTNGLTLGGTAAGNYTLSGVSGQVGITSAANAIALVSSLNPAGHGAPVSFTATLPAYATGTIQFLTNGVNFDLEALAAGTAGSLATALLPLGSNVITAAYSGDANDVATTNRLGQLVLAPQFNALTLDPAGLVMTGSFGVSNGTYYLLATTNLALPVGQWIPVLTNQFDGTGSFGFTNPVDPSAPQSFYLLQAP